MFKSEGAPSKRHFSFIRPLAQLAHDGQMLGTYEAQSRSVHEVCEDSRIDRNSQLSSGVELCKGSIFPYSTPLLLVKQQH
ncbi:hypothetical protein Sarmat_00739 [Rickettsiales endosymbiont of Paramecium tredecaurelia]|uniref:hypothetical protein n=1 Tax=Candidatus Sarmatiella mevalonica TaxID=2770581 RepID=UPI001922B7AA|nr:hypothetical protein [Candidatus Sarmatiella mevalonica]MBL3284881.1 hypothetical protein [Candidatus Sarmatiella mevalonica]